MVNRQTLLPLHPRNVAASELLSTAGNAEPSSARLHPMAATQLPARSCFHPIFFAKPLIAMPQKRAVRLSGFWQVLFSERMIGRDDVSNR
jgi:hypothetical protein